MPRSPGSGPQDLKDHPPLPTTAWSGPGGWLALALLLLLELGLFVQYAQREITWAYPFGYDQVQYLSQSYETFEDMLNKGVGVGLWHGLCQPTPQGILVHVQASLLFLVLGPSRLSALILNLLYFASFQVVLAATLRWLTQRWSVALWGVGLFLTAISPFAFCGGLTEFRLDLSASCLFGIVLCLVIRSRLFASRRWSLLAGTAAALLALLRTVTLAHLVGIGGVFGLFLIVRFLWRRRDPVGRQLVWRQATGLTLASTVLLSVSLPVLWHNRKALWLYYGIGHVTGPEKALRAWEFGAQDLLASLLFYPRSVWQHHAGPVFLALAAVSVLSAGVLGWRLRRRPHGDLGPWKLDRTAGAVFLAASLLVPLVVMTLDSSKSPVVGSIFLPPLLWLTAGTMLCLLGVDRFRPLAPGVSRTLTALAVLTVVAGACTQIDHFSRRSPLSLRRADAEEVVRLMDQITDYCREYGWQSPRIALDRNYDYSAGMLRPLAYERHRLLLSPQIMLGANLFPVPEADAVAALGRSDLVILTSHSAAPLYRWTYPFNKAMLELDPHLQAICNEDFLQVGEYHYYNEGVTLYLRPALHVEGGEGGWITRNGLTLTDRVGALRVRPLIELRGTSPMKLLDRAPGVRAELVTGDSNKPLPAEFSATGNDYRITITVPPDMLPTTAQATVRLSFDTFFIPREKFPNNVDDRELVLLLPKEVNLFRRPTGIAAPGPESR